MAEETTDSQIYEIKDRLEQSVERVTRTFLEEVFDLSNHSNEKQAVIELCTDFGYSELQQKLINKL